MAKVETKRNKTYIIAFCECMRDEGKWRIKKLKASSKRDAECQINSKFDYNGFKVLEVIKEK